MLVCALFFAHKLIGSLLVCRNCFERGDWRENATAADYEHRVRTMPSTDSLRRLAFSSTDTHISVMKINSCAERARKHLFMCALSTSVMK